jgi:hypothetical protein
MRGRPLTPPDTTRQVKLMPTLVRSLADWLRDEEARARRVPVRTVGSETTALTPLPCKALKYRPNLLGQPMVCRMVLNTVENAGRAIAQS